MDLIKITDLANSFDVTSRTLRYYEQVGILESNRIPDSKYRYYDKDAVLRMKQITILRKLQIPIKRYNRSLSKR